ncbi:hypothetical protein F5Y18DRAFT_400548 [Xylariaceae sp. FL1019]|nr:hypothetical protein F5Y18DRAFT_400548 [Xylariaceae sp. FL1019]
MFLSVVSVIVVSWSPPAITLYAEAIGKQHEVVDLMLMDRSACNFSRRSAVSHAAHRHMVRTNRQRNCGHDIVLSTYSHDFTTFITSAPIAKLTIMYLA